MAEEAGVPEKKVNEWMKGGLSDQDERQKRRKPEQQEYNGVMWKTVKCHLDEKKDWMSKERKHGMTKVETSGKKEDENEVGWEKKRRKQMKRRNEAEKEWEWKGKAWLPDQKCDSLPHRTLLRL